MTENEPNTVEENTTPVRVPESVLDGIRNEQHRIRQLRPKVPIPTQSELITKAWDAFTSTSDVRRDSTTKDSVDRTGSKAAQSNVQEIPSNVPKLTPDQRKYVGMLAVVLNSRYEQARNAVQHNLEVFSEFVEIKARVEKRQKEEEKADRHKKPRRGRR